MRFSILGPLDVHDGRRPVALVGGRQQKLLAILLLHANEPVASDVLIDALWGDPPPETAGKALQGHVSQLRKRLGHDTVETRAGGYVLRLDTDDLDAARFERLLRESSGLDGEAAARSLREALALWRGPALADFRYDEFAQTEAARLEELRLRCLEERIEADLELGEHEVVVAELEAAVRAHPLRERFRAQLMLALYRCGRQADALEAYRDGRRVLDEELGLEPGEELASLQRRILEHDPSLALPGGRRRPRPSRRRAPSQVALLLAVGVAASAAAVAAFAFRGGGSRAPVVVPPDSLARIDAKRGRLASYVAVGANPVAIAVAPDAVWVANAEDGTVARVDPRTGRLVHTIGVGADVSDVAVGFGSLWVADGNDNSLTRIDPETNRIVATFQPGGRPALAPDPVFFLAMDARHVWATQGNELLRIDPSTTRVTGRAVVGTPTGITTGRGSVWVTNSADHLLRIDAATMKTTGDELLSAPGSDLVYAGDSLWVVLANDRGTLDRFDPVTMADVAADVDGEPVLALAPLGGELWAAGGRDVSVFDGNGKLQRVVHVGGMLSAIAADGGAVWVAVASPT